MNVSAFGAANRIINALLRASSRDQTNDLLITSQLLYQLSYGGITKRSLKLYFSLPLLWCKITAKCDCLQTFFEEFSKFFLTH